MKSFGETYYLETSSPLRRLWRNARLAVYVLRVVWFWAVPGSRVRRRIRDARRTGKPFEIDQLA